MIVSIDLAIYVFQLSQSFLFRFGFSERGLSCSGGNMTLPGETTSPCCVSAKLPTCADNPGLYKHVQLLPAFSSFFFFAVALKAEFMIMFVQTCSDVV